MAWYPRPAAPATVWRDLRATFATRERHKLLLLAVSVAIPIFIVYGFMHDSYQPPRGPEIIYAQSWPADRPDSVIIAQQKVDQARRDKFLRERRESFRKVGRMFGMKVD